MDCRLFCGACCIGPSISSPIPGMPKGKKAGEKCIHLAFDFSCLIYNSLDRPIICKNFQADPLICGNDRDEALRIFNELES